MAEQKPVCCCVFLGNDTGGLLCFVSGLVLGFRNVVTSVDVHDGLCNGWSSSDRSQLSEVADQKEQGATIEIRLNGAHLTVQRNLNP